MGYELFAVINIIENLIEIIKYLKMSFSDIIILILITKRYSGSPCYE